MAKQTIELLSTAMGRSSSSLWWGAIPFVQIADDLTPSDQTRYFREVLFTSGGRITLDFERARVGNPTSGNDLSGDFETNGGIDITVSGTTYSFDIAGADTSELYAWVPSNSDDVVALHGAVTSATDATLVIRDGPRDTGFKLGFGGKTYNKVQFGGKTYNKMVFNGKTY